MVWEVAVDQDSFEIGPGMPIDTTPRYRECHANKQLLIYYINIECGCHALWLLQRYLGMTPMRHTCYLARKVTLTVWGGKCESVAYQVNYLVASLEGRYSEDPSAFREEFYRKSGIMLGEDGQLSDGEDADENYFEAEDFDFEVGDFWEADFTEEDIDDGLMDGNGICTNMALHRRSDERKRSRNDAPICMFHSSFVGMTEAWLPLGFQKASVYRTLVRYNERCRYKLSRSPSS